VDDQFIKVLGAVAEGRVTVDDMEYLKTLSRPLNCHKLGIDHIPKLYAKNEDCDFYNSMMLGEIEGNEFVLKATDAGTVRSKVAHPSILALKVGALDMQTRNVSASLRNGMTGTIHSFNSDGFPLVLQVIRPVSWSMYDRQEITKVIDSRLQLPLKLSWAITMHKCQGMTLKAAEVHVK